MSHDGQRQVTPRRILVVAADELSRHVVARRLQRHGYEPLLAARPAEAMAILAAHRVEAVVADDHLPGMTGTALAQALRGPFPHLPVLLMRPPQQRDTAPDEPPVGFPVVSKRAGWDGDLCARLTALLAMPAGGDDAPGTMPADAGEAPDPFADAHALRTPLTALRTSIDLLCRADLAPSEQRFAEMARRNLEQVVRLVDGLLAGVAVKL